MPTQDDLSSLPSATLRAALIAAEKREKQVKEWHAERKKIKREIEELQKRLDGLEKVADSSEAESKGKVVDRSQQSQRKGKRSAELLSDDEGLPSNWYGHRPIAKARRVDPPGPSHWRYVQ